MERMRKITVAISSELIDSAQRASGTGISQTVRAGLQLIAASQPMQSCEAFGTRFASRVRLT